MLLTQEVPAEELKEMFSKEYIPWKIFVRHKELIKNQYAVIQEVSCNLNEDIYVQCK